MHQLNKSCLCHRYLKENKQFKLHPLSTLNQDILLVDRHDKGDFVRLIPPISNHPDSELTLCLSTAFLFQYKIKFNLLRKNKNVRSNLSQSRWKAFKFWDLQIFKYRSKMLIKQAQKSFRPLSAMQGIGYFQNLGNILGIFDCHFQSQLIVYKFQSQLIV